MCYEFLLAVIYFSAILIINFFLFKVVINFIKNISYLIQLNNIYSLYQPSEIKNVSFLFLFSKKKLIEMDKLKIYENFLKKNSLEKKDVLIQGNTYKLLASGFDNSRTYFFELLEKQFLF